MPIQLTCPGCAAEHTLADELAGKKGRCKKCGQTFRIGSVGQTEGIAPPPVREPAGIATQPITQPAPPPLADNDGERPSRRKKKRRSAEGPSRRLIIGMAVGGGILALLLIGIAVTAIVIFSGSSDPRSRLIGKWKGVVDVQEAVQGAMDNATKGSNLNPIAKGILGAMAQKAAEAIASVDVDFKQSGTAYFTGNTSCLGISSARDGPWEVVRQDEDILFVRMGPPDDTFEARLAFSGANAFILTRPDKQEMPPVVFTRQK
jgi:hypothetical protein